MATKGTVVIDSGHGGTENMGGSDANHAVSPSGVLEKNMTLDFAKLVKDELQATEPDITVILTRTGDTNLTLEKRANFARDNHADLFLSIHFNGFNGVARGVEAWVRSQADGNVNHEDDKSFAEHIQKAVFAAIRARDPNTRDRGVKDMKLGVLGDAHLGNTAANHPCRACLLEIEFIDVPAVDQLLNTGPNAHAVRQEIAAAIKDVIVVELS